jgi:hypothetical protein
MDKPTVNDISSDPKILPSTKKPRSAKQLEAYKKMREAKIKSLELKKKLQSTKNRPSDVYNKSEEYEEDSEYKSSDNNGGGMNNPPAVAVSRPREVPNSKPQKPQKPKPKPRKLEDYYEDGVYQPLQHQQQPQQPQQTIVNNYVEKPQPLPQQINYVNNPYGLNTVTYSSHYIQKHLNTEQNSRRVRRQIPNIPWRPNAYY